MRQHRGHRPTRDNSWKWPIFQWFYMGALAWILAFVHISGRTAIGLALMAGKYKPKRCLVLAPGMDRNPSQFPGDKLIT